MHLVRLLHGTLRMRLWCALLLLVTFSACGRDESADTATPASDTVTTSPDTADARFDPKAAQATAPPGRIALLQKDVQVTLAEYRISGLPETLMPGQVTFNVSNAGTHEHSFEVEGEGIERALDRPLQPGQSAKLVVDLRAGTYKVYCPVADHEDRGMTRPLVVQ